jgi:hypothetical protein
MVMVTLAMVMVAPVMARGVKIGGFRSPNKATASVARGERTHALATRLGRRGLDLLIELSYGIIMVCLTPATGIRKGNKVLC